MSLDPAELRGLFDRVVTVTAEDARAHPGDPGGRQPVHTLYVPADRFSADTLDEVGAEARRLLQSHAGDPPSFAAAFDLPAELAEVVAERVAVKLREQPVEDLRIDFEDGYGVRDDDTEDAHVAAAATVVADAMAAGTLPPFAGLRVKSFCDGLHERSVRSLDGFLTTLLERTGGRPPDGFAITFPKIVAAGQVAAFAEVCGRMEEAMGLPENDLRVELQVETTQSIVDRDGRLGLAALVAAGGGRVSAAHFGVFDYTAACGLLPAHQRSTHPACDFARHVMQATLAGTGVRLSDGSTNVVPAADTRDAVHAAWRAHAAGVRHSWAHGFYQGWDLHAAHLPSRFATVYATLLADLDEAIARISAWATASATEGVLDEPATIRSLLGQVRRAVDCGAIDRREVSRRTGLQQLPGR
ncbi:MAG: aldolase [Euzebyales bacterium]|nr:aldolase [Euzebyales bacterium]